MVVLHKCCKGLRLNQVDFDFHSKILALGWLKIKNVIRIGQLSKMLNSPFYYLLFPFFVCFYLLANRPRHDDQLLTQHQRHETFFFFCFKSFGFNQPAVAFRVLVERGTFNPVSVNSWTETEPKNLFYVCGGCFFVCFCFLKKRMSDVFVLLTVDICQ